MRRYKRKHSVMYDVFKRRYGEFYTKKDCYIAVKNMKWITEAEYKELTGEDINDYEE